MGKVLTFKSLETKDYQEYAYCLHDFLNLNMVIFKSLNRFGTWSTLFANYFRSKSNKRFAWNRKRESIRLAKKIIETFFELVIEDMLEEEDELVFPEPRFARMKIAEVSDCYFQKTFNIATMGKKYQPVIIFHPFGYSKVGKLKYYCKFTRRYNVKFEEKIKQGYQYKNLKDDIEHEIRNCKDYHVKNRKKSQKKS